MQSELVVLETLRDCLERVRLQLSCSARDVTMAYISLARTGQTWC